MAKVDFPKIIMTCDNKHVQETLYLPNAITKTGGCTCRRDRYGFLESGEYCYCSSERSVVEWWCDTCQKHYKVELD